MRFFVYVIIFIIVLLVVKAFFLDSYYQEKNNIESNTSTEAVSEDDSPLMRNKSLFTEKKEKSKPNNEGMPLDELGDSIAEKIADNL